MTTLDLAQTSGRTYRKVSSHNGGEYHGACPGCGGTDRFHLWPHQGEHGTFWCRQCDKAGDAIDYLMTYEGKTFREAAAHLGKEVQQQSEYQRPQFKRPAAAENFQPRQCQAPADLWREHATKLVDWAHQQLLDNPNQLNWLAARGLDLEAVKRYRLGWNPGEKGKDLYRVRESWGLETILKDDQKTKKKLWLPIGLVIPCYVGDTLHRIRIRRPEGEPRYYLVPGSGTAPMIQNSGCKASVVVESELDALLVHHLAGDLVGTISQGNSTAKPDETADTMLRDSLAILVALDSDQAGMLAAVWWRKQYPQAERWPVPAGKDPGEAYKAGVDIREWVKTGLPPVLTLPPKRRPVAVAPVKPQDHPGEAAPMVSSDTGAGGEQPAVHTITAQDGRLVNITDDPAAYSQLARDGKIVFSSTEIGLIKQLGANPEEAAAFLDFKQVFPGIRITEIGPVPQQAQSEAPVYRGRFYTAR